MGTREEGQRKGNKGEGTREIPLPIDSIIDSCSPVITKDLLQHNDRTSGAL